MTYVNARRDIEGVCLPGTREEVLDAILGWAAQATSRSTLADLPKNNLAYSPESRVLWVCGLSGSGKSTIARSVAARLSEIGRLGSFYAFDESRQAALNPGTLFSTIARNLADCDAARKKALVEAIRHNMALRKSQSASEQFDEFIVAPSSQVPAIGDTVIVVDGFDESSNVIGRRALLSILTARASDIPTGLKFIVTSRFESDVQNALEKDTRPPGVDLFLLDDVPEYSTSRDIAKFIHHTLGSVKPLKQHTTDLDRLSMMAEHSFQWAATACRFVLAVDNGFGAAPTRRLAWLIQSDDAFEKSPRNPHRRLHQLYTAIPDRNFSDAAPDVLSSLKSILGLMICAAEPLTLRSLIALSLSYDTPTEDDLYECQHIFRSMGSLISGVHDLDTVVKPLHASFTDYLGDGEKSGKYSVDVAESKVQITRRCFEIMHGGLRFNICNFPTSFRRNSEIENLASKVSTKISFLLSYSSRHWPHHVSELGNSTSGYIESLVLHLLQDQFLYWLEVMSLLGCNPQWTLNTLSPVVSSLRLHFKGIN